MLITKELLQQSGYYISEQGAVWSYIRDEPTPLKTSIYNGYKRLRLAFKVKGKRRRIIKQCPVHRLVCTWYHGTQPTPNHVVNHKDGNKLNNHKDNVEWVTQRENVNHYYKLLKKGLDGSAKGL